MTNHLLRFIDPYPFVPRDPATRTARCEEIVAIQTLGLARRLRSVSQRLGITSLPVAIGISGGLDSTLALLVTVRAFDALGWPRNNIKTRSMPGFGTSARTRKNAAALVEKLGTSFEEISIVEAATQHLRRIGHEPCMRCVQCQNAQARERTHILMDTAFVIGTGDLSEIALGWSTYNGDHMSMYNVNAGVPKTLVQHLVRFVAEHADTPAEIRATLLDILDTPISPELEGPDASGAMSQKTEEIIGPYELHDFFLFHVLRNGFEPEKVLFLAKHANDQKGFSRAYSDRELAVWLGEFYRRFANAQFKRDAAPDGPKVGSVALSQRGDWRMPTEAFLRNWIDRLSHQ
jgi:NAD+ synthase (glutamine-hydrolysing)